MELLQVNDVKKTYTTRFGGNQVQALKGVSFTVEGCHYGRIRFRKDDPSQYPCSPGSADRRPCDVGWTGTLRHDNVIRYIYADCNNDRLLVSVIDENGEMKKLLFGVMKKNNIY